MLALAAILGVLGALLAPALAQARPPVQAQRPFEVMTFNVYLGTDLSPLFAITDPAQLIPAAAAAYQHVVDTDFNERGEAIAEQIAEASPDVVGLQEVSLWQTAPLSDPSAVTTQYDFLAILLDELEEQGHPYEAVSVNETFSASLPISMTTLCIWTDRNVILVRDRQGPMVITNNAVGGKYVAALPVRSEASLSP